MDSPSDLKSVDRLPGYRGACQGAPPRLVPQIIERCPKVLGVLFEIEADASLILTVSPGSERFLCIRYRLARLHASRAQFGQRLVRFVHEQGDADLAAVTSDPLIQACNHGFRALVAMPLYECVDVLVAERMDGGLRGAFVVW